MAALIALATFGAVLAIFVVSLDGHGITKRDFIEYWAAAQQLRHGANPYDPASILRLQRSVGLEEGEPKLSISPPIAFVLLLPLGVTTPKTGFIFWLVACIGSLWLSIWMLWVLHGKRATGLHLCCYMFAPALACLMAGQLGIFLLLAVVLFLYWHESHPYLAGAALLPCAYKPHLFLPIFIVLVLWSGARRDYRVIIGCFSSVLATSVLTLSFDPQLWSQYFRMMKTTNVMHGFVPTLSVTARWLIDPDAVWIQFIPETAACVWAVWYFWTRRERWSWLDHGMLLLLLALLCTPYAWFTDEAVLLPALLAAAYYAEEHGRSLLPIAVVATAALVEVCAFGHMASKLYLWTAPAWLACYLYGTWNKEKHPKFLRQNAQAIGD